jgi:hypothetical protein
MYWKQMGRINRPTYFLGLGLLLAFLGLWLAFLNTSPKVAELCFCLIAVPRLHDINKSGWWAGALVLGEFLVLGIAFYFAGSSPNSMDVILITSGIYVMIVVGLMVWLGCIKGDAGSNRFGDVPPDGISWKNYRYVPQVNVVTMGADRFGAKPE